MKHLRQISGWLAVSLAMVLLPHVGAATPLTEDSDLVKATRHYERIVKMPDECPGPQRTLIAVNLAAAVTGTTNASDIFQAYWIAGGQDGDRITRSTDYTWNGTAWDEQSRTTNTWDGVASPLQILDENKEGDLWVKDQLETNTFDGSGRLETSLDQSWSANQWDNESQRFYGYNGSELPTEVITQMWVDDAWLNWARILFNYNGMYVQSTTTQMWSEGGWVNQFLSTYSYDGIYVTQVLSQLWLGGVWTNQSRATTSYDGMHYVSQVLTEVWDTGGWDNSSKSELVWNGAGQQTLDRFWFWSFVDPINQPGVKGWALFEVDTSKYSGSHNTEDVRVGMFGGTVTSLSRTLYSYTGDNVTEEIDQTGLPGLAAATWTNSARTTYEYESGSSAVQLSDTPAPAGWELNQNYPNPFNPTTSIRYSLQRTGQVEVTVYNMLGQTVRVLENGVQAPGVYETTWDGRDAHGKEVASGMYLYRISTDDFTETRKMMLLK